MWGVQWCPAMPLPPSRARYGTSSPSPRKRPLRWTCPPQLSSPTSPCESVPSCLHCRSIESLGEKGIRLNPPNKSFASRWESERHDNNAVLLNREPNVKLHDYVQFRLGPTCIIWIHRRRLSFPENAKYKQNKYVNSAGQTASLGLDLGAEAGQEEGGPEGRWIRVFVDRRQKVNRENDRSVPSSPPLPHTVYWGSLPA